VSVASIANREPTMSRSRFCARFAICCAVRSQSAQALARGRAGAARSLEEHYGPAQFTVRTVLRPWTRTRMACSAQPLRRRST
jgi:hypothetical protein